MENVDDVVLSDGDAGHGMSRRHKVDAAVAQWVSQLIDLTGNNQLLYYRTLKAGTLELTGADENVLGRVLAGGKVRLSQLFRGHPAGSPVFEDALKRARTIHSKALTHFEERGIDTLYLAVGMAEWTTTSTRSQPAAPLLVRPLKLDPRGAASPDFDVELHGDWDVNRTLLHLLATEFKVEVDGDGLLSLLEADADALDPSALYDRFLSDAASVPDMQVVPRLVVGTFAYTKLPMVIDLQENVDQLAAHDLIAAIAGDGEAREIISSSHASEVSDSQPDVTPPSDEFLILDADSSQNAVINAAVAGESLIVQGPPGTGKSQTIANLIATMTARGKRVLFVAEKRAAIDAVTKRLGAAGLGDLVLDLHGGVTSKRQLAGELGDTLAQIGRVPRPAVDELHRTVERSREALRKHADAIHLRRPPWGVSAFEASAQALALAGVPGVGLRLTRAQLEQLDAGRLRQAQRDLEEWARLAAPILAGTSAWGRAQVTSAADVQAARDLAVDLAEDTVPAARQELDRTIAETGLRAPRSITEWQVALAYLDAVGDVLAVVDPKVFELDLDQVTAALEPAARSAWTRMTSHLFRSKYRLAKRAVRERWIGAAKPSAAQLHAAAASARDVAARWEEVGGVGAPRIPENLATVTAAYGQLSERLAALGAFLLTTDLTSRHHTSVLSDVTALVDDQTVYRLPRIVELEAAFDSLGLAPLLDEARSGSVGAEDLPTILEATWLRALVDVFRSVDPHLASFDGVLHHRRSDEFRDADRQHIAITPERVRRAVAERCIEAFDRHRDQEALLRKQTKLKRAHMPLRRLVAQAPDVLTSIRPCWAMSPLVVSQMLPAAEVFDLVIFDEASQVLPADAIPALLRAPQAIVAGDSRQLPPTTFFGGTAADTDDEEGDEAALTSGFESILDVLDALLGSRMLTWHYRSRDERLIHFSNQRIYGGGLITFPGGSVGQRIHHVLVQHQPGPTDTKSNPDEVARVVELMIEHATVRPEETLGVIAMGQYHAARIEAALRDRLQDDSDPALMAFFDETREERTFVKNLERVQGDERDAIILSVGYGKTSDGHMQYRWGPINGQGGERRLNVAVTRARARMTMVSSFSYAEVDPSRTRSQGADLLRQYVGYAESGGGELEGGEQAHPLNPFELDVQRRLENAGLRVVPQYGVSGFRIDFVVPHPDYPGRMILAVEADGASYHSSPTTRDRDRLRQQILEAKGWHFCRIWSTDWFNDPADQVQRVLAAYERAVTAEQKVGQASSAPSPSALQSTPPSHDTVTARPWPRPAVKPGQSIANYTEAELTALAAWIRSDTLLRTEAQLLDEMMRELGFSRRGHRIVDALTHAIRASNDDPAPAPRVLPVPPAPPTPPGRPAPPAPPAPGGSNTHRSTTTTARPSPPPRPPETRPHSIPALRDPGGLDAALGDCDRFVVIDVETTGLGRHDRVVEVAAVTVNGQGHIIDEWDTLVDPQRDVGPVHIHRVSASMVAAAPRFEEVAAALAQRIDGAALVAHNLSFDVRMLAAEFERAGAELDHGRGLCTLRLGGGRLVDACSYHGIELEHAHRALADARATARLLSRVVQYGADPCRGATVRGLTHPFRPRTLQRDAVDAEAPAMPYLAVLSSHLHHRGEHGSHLAYVDLVDRVVSDLMITETERKALRDLAADLGLGPVDIAGLHQRYVDELIAAATRDEIVTDTERNLIHSVAEALGVDSAFVDAELAAWTPGADAVALTEGMRVCFTGTATYPDGSELERDDLGLIATQMGLEVVSGVTKSRCDLLVAADLATRSQKADDARRWGIPVVDVHDFLTAAETTTLPLRAD